MTLPDPICQYGYTQEQLHAIFGARLHEFEKWFTGQTGAICDDPGCGEHGLVVYRWDVERYVAGRPVID